MFLSNQHLPGGIAESRGVRAHGRRTERDAVLLRQPRLPGGDVQPGRHRTDVHAELGLGPGQQARRPYQRTRRLVDHNAICLAAVKDDDVARRVIDRVAEYIADCAVMIANALDVELLVIGGRAITHVAEI